MKAAIISVTNNGNEISEKLKDFIKADVFYRDDVKQKGLKDIVEKAFNNYKSVIFIASTGIAVRAIAPYIKRKDIDPAVIVIDSSGKFVISLLSGHLGGANELTENIAEYIDAVPVITTATDNMGIIAPDIIAKQKGYIIDSLKDAKVIAAMLVDNQKVAYVEEYIGENIKTEVEESIPKGYTNKLINAEGAVVVTNKVKINYSIPCLKLINKNIVLGIGCRKNFSQEKMREKVLETLEQYNIDRRAVKTIATVDIKKNEKAILDLVEFLHSEYKIFITGEIKNIHNKYIGSDFVEKTIGVRAVCEPCCELAGGKLITGKIKLDGMTICIGINQQAEWRNKFE